MTYPHLGHTHLYVPGIDVIYEALSMVVPQRGHVFPLIASSFFRLVQEKYSTHEA